MILGIVIVNYHSDDQTVQFVQEQLCWIKMHYELVIVDNGGGDGSALRERLPKATVLVSENKGYASACNLGADWLWVQYHPDAFLFCNTDIYFFSHNVAEALFNVILRHEDVGAAGPCIVGMDDRRQSPEPYQGLWSRYVWMYLLTPFLTRERKVEKFRLDYAEKASEGYHYKLMGCFLMVDAVSFRRVGGFDEHTFLYAEEPILSERLATIGKRCYYYPAVTVFHEHGAVIGASYDRKERDRMQFESMAYYYRRYKGYPAWEIAIVRLLYRLIQCFR